MSLWKIAWRSIQQRALASSLTALSMALGVALVIAVLVALGVVSESFKRGSGGYHLVVGKKGSQLQLVLNTVYHLQEPIENLPYPFYKEFLNTPDHKGKFAPYVKTAIPYCLGDNYEGFRVVGTVPALFNDLEYAGGKKYEFQPPGRNFEPDHFFEAVIGATVAQKTGLKVGDEFQPTHGLSDEGDGHKHDAFKIVGVLKPTGTANDRALFINIEGFYLLENHAKEVDASAAGHDQHAADADHHDAHAHDADHDHAAGEHQHDEAAHDHDADHDHKEAPHDHDAHAAAGAGPEHHDDHTHEEPAAAVAPAERAAQEVAGHDSHGDADHDHAHDDHAHEKGATAREDHDHAGHDHDHAATPGDAHDHADHAAHDHAGHDHDAHDHAGHGHDGHDHGHDHAGHHHHEPLPENQREITSILVLANNDLNAVSLRTMINEGEAAQAVFPVKVISEFFDTLVRGISIALLSLTVLIIVVAGVGVMVSIYNSMNDRRRDIAVMRALGAGRQTVLSVILLESILLAVGGGVLGFVLGHGLIGILGPIVETFTGVRLGFVQFVPYELILIPGLVVLAALAGYLPAMSAYRTDVAKALSASP